MTHLETLIFLMFVAILLVGLAQKLHIAYPVPLVIGGALIGFIPGFAPISFDSNLILTAVLPPLLYYTAFWTSFREFKNHLKEIFSLALGLVLITTLLIGILFKWFFPQFPWALAFAFGAIVSPPDAFAATTVLRRFAIHPRLLTILEGESLVNDASAIILYKFSIIALLLGSFSLSEATYEFVKISIGGVFTGIMIGFFIQIFSKRFLEPVVSVVFSFINPYLTYVLAERFEFSGVLAVVANGLIGSYLIIKYQLPRRRILGYTSWDIFIILLNCFVFILIGSHLQSITQKITLYEMVTYSSYAVLISIAMIMIRTGWVILEKLISYFFFSRSLKKSFQFSHLLREITILSWSGMRGIVSLTVALSLPLFYPNGMPIIGKEIILLMTFVVILFTLLIPALTLPFLLRFWKIQQRSDTDIEFEIRKQLLKAANAEINRLHSMHQIDHEERAFLIHYFEAHQRLIALSSAKTKPIHRLELARLKIIQVQRNLLLLLWENEEIDDNTLRHLEQELDMDEILSTRAEIA